MLNKIGLLIYREIQNMLQFRAGLLVQIIYPLSYFLLFAVGISSNIRTIRYLGNELPFIIFLTPGLIAMQTFTQFQQIYMSTSNDRRFGIMKLLILGGIGYTEVVISKVFLSLFLVFLQSLFITIGLWVVSGFIPSFPNLILTIVTLIVASVFWGSLGIGLGVRIVKEETRNIIMLFISLPIMFSSSVFYNPIFAPKWIYYLSRINPLTYTADAIRNVFLNKLDHFINNLLAIFAFSFIALILSYISFNRANLPQSRSG